MTRTDHDTADLRALVAGLDSVDPEVRSASALAVSRFRASSSIHQLVDALYDRDVALSRWAATTLGLRGDARALEPLVRQLASDDVTLREAAAGALGLLGHTDAVGPLVLALGDADARVAQAAALSLTRLGDDRGAKAVHGGLVEQLRDDDPDERAFAARTLGALGDRRASAALVEALTDPSAEVRADAAEALGKVANKDAMAPLLEAGFRDADATVRDTAMFALARMSEAFAGAV